jgi:hypothetical protein
MTDFQLISASFHPLPLISWSVDPPSRPPHDPRPNLAAFHPGVAGFFDRLPALAPRLVYQLSRRLLPDSGRFSPHRRRFWPYRTGFGSSIDRSKWGMKNPLCCQFWETKYHIHE